MSTRLRPAILTGLLLAGLLLAGPRPAAAQEIGVRGFAGIDWTMFTADQSFETVLGTRTLTGIDGGGEVLIGRHLFARVEVSRYREQGERVFVSDDTTIPLGIGNTITITPVLVSGGYRFPLKRLVPYVGAGLGWHRYQERDEFSTAEEEVDETFTGYHVLGGLEFPLLSWLAVAGEAQWSTVRDALGQDPNSVSAHFGETDLGGTTVRIKVVVGR